MADLEAAAQQFGKQLAERLFDGRTGHGKAPVSYLQLRPDDVANIAATAFEAGARIADDVNPSAATAGADTTTLRELAEAALLAAMKDGRRPNEKNSIALAQAREDLFSAINRLSASHQKVSR